MAKNNIVKVGGELKSIAADGVVAGAEAIYDYNENKTQQVINQELREASQHIDVDDAPTSGSDNPVSSNGVYEALQDIDVTSQISGKADKSEMSVVAGTGADADKTTITLKSGTSATVLTQHQNIRGKQDTISSVTVAVDDNTGTPAGSVTFANNTLAFSFQNLKGEKGDTGESGIQGVRGERGPVGANGVTTDANIAIITGIDKTTAYDSTKDVASAEAVQDLVKMLGTVYYTQPT